ncbi:NAD-dependent succinate-semialdehyde dehydrogenase [Acidaminobacter sp. JC074]|uniref:NAD-dependent succinate-semialdehyde dehydrogenase n=1 Tax=Acidaminobacter sp. JC074 TaxID=2530199 RepID=UPI001F0E9C7F|nr:NAD-dependent succinate-semialdehyde dehydrogenase [Acidaminobacter sp. JC074]MCH4887366.1 NAD-dependent succinate-semialdehyde dehydrogenase [Acidaminobacter sp. JC074]
MKYSIFYDGSFQEHEGDYFKVYDPSNGNVLGEVPNASESDMEKTIESAYKGFEFWRDKTAEYRCDLLEKLYDLVIEEKENLAKIMTMENGKPYLESLGEIVYGANFLKWYSEEGKRIYGQFIPASSENKRIMVRKQPVGLVYGITPWNFPFAMITRKLAPALAAGCTFIIKPAAETPLTALKFFELVERVGFPKGVCSLITGDAKTLTEVAMKDSRVRKITFTGSTAVGKLLMKQSSETVKKISLELGGHAPLIVFDDADIDKAIKGTLASKFRNCGQVCIATNRVLVHEKIHDLYLEKLTEQVLKMKIGNGFEDQVKIGPVINKKGVDKIDGQVKDAIEKGAKLVCGGESKHVGDNDDVGHFYKPTILDGVTRDMAIFYDETFGPVIPVITFKDDQEAIDLANDTPYGLASYFFTESISKAFVVAEKLDYGMVGLNTGAISAAQAPFGGVKESGIGREGGHFGIEEYLETKYVCLEI